MQTVQSVSSADALKASRAFGAMIFSFFGVVLLEVWDRRTGAGVTVFAGIALLGLALLAMAYLRYRRARCVSGASHVVLAAALVGFALAYPQLASGGPADPVGFLGTGLMLWANALWALRNPVRQQA